MIKKLANVDTICILVDIANYEKVAKKILDILEKEKEKSKIGNAQISNYKQEITIENMNFEVLPNGSQGYAYILKNNGYEIKIAQTRSKLEAFYPLQVRISSEYLWAYGLINSWTIIYNWIEKTFGRISDNKVFRIDLATHVSNIDFTTNYEQIYKGKFKKMHIFHTGNEINCVAFGSRKSKNIYCRIYNKTLEIQENKRKTWFKEIWKLNGLDIKNVWNVEFEIKSELLREFKLNNIKEIENHLKDLWIYCTNNFITKVDRINSRIERCPIDKEWQELQKAYDNFLSTGFIKREKQIELDAQALIPNIVGNITSYSARKGERNIFQAFEQLCRETTEYLNNKETTFAAEVENKLLLINERGEKNG